MILNRRHKAGLFLTGVAAGCGLFLELSAKQAVGITLIGIAFSWLIGSLTPRALSVTLAILICAVGLYVAASPVWSDWESTQKSTAEYDLAINDLQSAVKNAVTFDLSRAQPLQRSYSDLPKGAVIAPTKPAPTTRTIPIPKGATIGAPLDALNGKGLSRTVQVPESAKRWVRPEQKEPEGWKPVDESSVVVVFPNSMPEDELIRAFTTRFLLPRPAAFSLTSAVRAHALSVFGGLALFTSSLSGLIWLFRRNPTSRASFA